MNILIVLGIAIVWIVAGLKEKLETPNPPIDSKDISEHCRKVLSFPDVKSRQKYLKSLKKK